MLKDFGNKHTESLWKKKKSTKWKNIETVALRKLNKLDETKNLFQLTSLTGNYLEALRGKWKGYYSIRINKQFRLVFIWEKGNAYQVEITDYH